MTSTYSPLSIVSTDQKERADVLHKPAREISFPLSKEILALINEMKDFLTNTLHGAGLAAPQVGKDLNLIVYQVTEEALKIREDAREVVPLMALINPSYEIIPDSGITYDWEFCFSVLDKGGKVYRPTSIRYRGYLEDGTYIEKKAHGFLARLLQHEIDHVNGLLCGRLYPEGGFYGNREAMMEIRQKEIASKEQKCF